MADSPIRGLLMVLYLRTAMTAFYHLMKMKSVL